MWTNMLFWSSYSSNKKSTTLSHFHRTHRMKSYMYLLAGKPQWSQWVFLSEYSMCFPLYINRWSKNTLPLWLTSRSAPLLFCSHFRIRVGKMNSPQGCYCGLQPPHSPRFFFFQENRNCWSWKGPEVVVYLWNRLQLPCMVSHKK